MSQLIVEVCTIDEIKSHPSADRLELAIVKGFQTVIAKGSHVAGDVIVYIPYDSIVPKELSDRFNFTQYLSNGRVKVAKLRGEPSYGVIIPNETNKSIDEDVAEELGITKYIPNVRRVGSGGRNTDEETPHPLFPRYTEIENLRHYPNVFAVDEPVSVTEKLHGTNARLAVIDGIEMAGSRRLQRKTPMIDKASLTVWEWVLSNIFRYPKPQVVDEASMADNWVWFPWTIPSVNAMLSLLSAFHKQVVLFGEVFGKNVQKGVRYGSPDKLAFRVFDLIIDGRYLDNAELRDLCASWQVDLVPELYNGPYSLDKIKELSSGKTTVGENETHIREGVVIRPLQERHDQKVGRAILKYVSDQYLLAKDIGDFEDE